MGRNKFTWRNCCISLTVLTASLSSDVAFATDFPKSISELADRTWRVTGIISDSVKGHEIAILEHLKSGRSVTLRMGERLGDGFALESVSVNVVVFSKGSDRRSIEISRGIGSKPEPASAEKKKGQTSPPDGATGSELQRISVRMQRLEELLDNLDELAKQVGMETITGPDGNKSLRISAISDTRLLDEFGLSDGDILLAADGERITDAEDLLDIVQDAEPGDAIPIAFQREGEIRQTVYQIEE